MAGEPDAEWEKVGEEPGNFRWKTHRMRVPGGWIYRVMVDGPVAFATMTFVKDA